MSTNDGMTLLATAGERIEQPTGVVLNQGHEIRATDPRLGRVPLFDYRSRDYPVRALVPDRAQPQGKHWYCRQRLDQGNPDGIAKFSASACTGHSRTLDLAASPNPLKMEIKDRHSVPFTRQYAHALYRLAQTLDDWPGELYEGSSVLGALKAAQQLGFVGEYRWAFGVEDAVLALSYVGGTVTGSDWLNSMFDPKPNGLLEVDVNSGVAGGHAWYQNRVITARDSMRRVLGKGEPIREQDVLVGGVNSWWDADSKSMWGLKGEYLIWASDWEKLLKGVDYPGECAITTTPFKK
jgi:hypothetical protein